MTKVGPRLKELRRRRGLGIRDVAIRAGVSHSTISLIERDKVSPTIDTLSAILDALGSTLAGFVSELRSDSGASPFYRAAELVEIGDVDATGVSYRVAGINHPNRHILMLHETYAPGADTKGVIAHQAQEAGFVISGRVEVSVGKDTATLGAGDAYYFDSRLPHRFRNISDEPSEIISAVTPPTY